jgi:two-component system chemotaxis sensor kinase CheA
VAQGLVAAKQAEALDDLHAAELVFRGGFTTSTGITRVSGRGLGLAIVREKVERLGGAVSIASRPNGGTRVEMLLPTTLATIRGVLVEAGGLPFVIPGVQVERVALVDAGEVRSVEGRGAIAIGGRTVALAELRAILELPAAASAPDARLPVVVLGHGEQRVAFAVDQVVEELEVLAKPLLPPLKRVRNVSGATVLASGRIAPILNVADLVKSARRAGPFRAAGAQPPRPLPRRASSSPRTRSPRACCSRDCSSPRATGCARRATAWKRCCCCAPTASTSSSPTWTCRGSTASASRSASAPTRAPRRSR